MTTYCEIPGCSRLADVVRRASVRPGVAVQFFLCQGHDDVRRDL